MRLRSARAAVKGQVVKLATLKSRSQFLAVRGGGRWSGPAFVLEGKVRGARQAGIEGPRFGFTVTKKMGNAVARNRMRRRLREAVRITQAEHADPRFDYVLIAREQALDRPFDVLRKDLVSAFKRVNLGPRDTSQQKRPG